MFNQRQHSVSVKRSLEKDIPALTDENNADWADHAIAYSRELEIDNLMEITNLIEIDNLMSKIRKCGLLHARWQTHLFPSKCSPEKSTVGTVRHSRMTERIKTIWKGGIPWRAATFTAIDIREKNTVDVA